MRQVREMDPRIFRPESLDLRGRLLDLDLGDRLAFDADRNILFLNFEGLHVRSSRDVAAIRETVT
jgi:propionate CoA-transferase